MNKTRKSFITNKLLVFVLLLNIQIAYSQQVEVQGELKVTQMNINDSEDNLVVRNSDGILGTRSVASLPPPPIQDTARTLQSDLLLTSALCNCSSLPPAMIQSLLNNGYSIADLFDFQIPLTELLAGGVSIGDLLNSGQSPIVLFNGGVTADSLYGKMYGGGLIFYIDTLDIYPTFEGLVSAPFDQSADSEWGCNGTSISGANGTVIGAGSINTTKIEDACLTSGIAADTCANLDLNGFMDWFLPSQDELNEMYLKIGPVAPSPNTNIAEFVADTYWSSTQIGASSARFQNLGNGSQGSSIKTYNDNVRAVRAF